MSGETSSTNDAGPPAVGTNTSSTKSNWLRTLVDKIIPPLPSQDYDLVLLDLSKEDGPGDVTGSKKSSEPLEQEQKQERQLQHTLAGWRKYFQPVDQHQTDIQTPPELIVVGRQFLYGSFAGCSFGAYHGLKQVYNKDVVVPSDIKNTYHRAQYLFVVNGLKYGLSLGLFASSYTALKFFMEDYRGTKDFGNAMAAAGMVGTVFGMRLRRGIPGILAVASGAAVIAGASEFAYERMLALLPEEQRAMVKILPDPEPVTSQDSLKLGLQSAILEITLKADYMIQYVKQPKDSNQSNP